MTDQNSTSRYTAQFKAKVVLEALTTPDTDTSIASAFGVHPVTLSRWKSQFLRNAAKSFSAYDLQESFQETLEEIQEILAHRDSEIKLLRAIIDEAVDTETKVELVTKHRETYGLNRICEVLGLPKSTYYYRINLEE